MKLIIEQFKKFINEQKKADPELYNIVYKIDQKVMVIADSGRRKGKLVNPKDLVDKYNFDREHNPGKENPNPEKTNPKEVNKFNKFNTMQTYQAYKANKRLAPMTDLAISYQIPGAQTWNHGAVNSFRKPGQNIKILKKDLEKLLGFMIKGHKKKLNLVLGDNWNQKFQSIINLSMGWLLGSFYPQGNNYGSPTPFMRVLWHVASKTIESSNKLANDLPIAAITGLVIPFSDSKKLLNNLVANIDALAGGQFSRAVFINMAGNFSGLANETDNEELQGFFKASALLSNAIGELVGS
tara:strand:- start:1145 stop:2032 length:888 start_codon:yes stop_codon:yes gene_type:complete